MASGLWAAEGLTGGPAVEGGHDRPGIVRSLLGAGEPDSATFAAVASAHDHLNRVVWGDGSRTAVADACRLLEEAASTAPTEGFLDRDVVVATVTEVADKVCTGERPPYVLHGLVENLEREVRDRVR